MRHCVGVYMFGLVKNEVFYLVLMQVHPLEIMSKYNKFVFLIMYCIAAWVMSSSNALHLQ